jgi:hypothetical protein
MQLSVVHNMLMVGPPGAGKTLLARAIPSILPHMTIDESLDVTRIYSVSDQLPPGIPLIQNRPFRAALTFYYSPRKPSGRKTSGPWAMAASRAANKRVLSLGSVPRKAR